MQSFGHMESAPREDLCNCLVDAFMLLSFCCTKNLVCPVMKSSPVMSLLSKFCSLALNCI